MSSEENETQGIAARCKEHFPISWLDDDFVSRREFTKSLGLVSLAAFVATTAVAAMNAVGRRARDGHPIEKVASVDELAVGESKVFQYPDSGNPCLLVRTEERKFVAYEQKCTHLGCPVYYEHAEGLIVCPCHVGYFSVEDGTAIAGPPKRPLPKIEVALEGEELWTTGTIA